MHFGWHWLPNILTLVRFALIVPFAIALNRGQFMLALGLFMLAAISDGADGFLARRFGWFSRFGAIADPLADKALLLTTYAMMALTDLIPDWLLIVIVARDLLIVTGALAYHFLIGRYQMSPSLLGKANTFIQILFVVIVMAEYAGLSVPDFAVPMGIYLVALSTALSGFHYVVVWSLRARREAQA
ncbi:CDP-alcohol phosphatidyltransferase family protein [Hydrocarboniclastica marina]|uniref:CDP-diacylglycerol--glycerol-3-phosphate 3-phosphatidyltransferase n=1 Tax=Hydrocarboniclastica marina TaxID=2259620 RepID=A0A4P7XH44_9ALTE|nr:CDP-alcohol phosphatidyltransferase family protein [Hydrocarboniclastica marina]MAL98927.1 CDP-alcohol phosphatidyltransferase [Alteromonadaceae bacterium]QCF26351.1 CDP-alcohol phosphatidyltransferase family protein [Hydrocarboniclastica marina]|tara:strand:- start:307 stop:864 length:558 start_codon:yes stop_codon:yes gene_type:complete